MAPANEMYAGGMAVQQFHQPRPAGQQLMQNDSGLRQAGMPQRDGGAGGENEGPAGRRGRRGRPNHLFNGRNVRLNAKICQVSERGDLWELLDLVEAHHVEMNCVNLSTLLHRVARLAKKMHSVWAVAGHPQLAVIRRKIDEELAMHEANQFTVTPGADTDSLPRCWATIAWSYATLQIRDVTAFQRIALLAKARLEAFKTFELANLLWAFAKNQIHAPALLEAIVKLVPSQLHSFSPVSLSTIAWAYVTLQPHPPAALLKRIATVFIQQIDAAESQEIANMCWALATAKVVKPPVFQELGNAAAAKLSTFNIQELANTAWAFSRAGVRHQELFAAYGNLFTANPSLAFQFHAQGLANILWAMAKQVTLGNQRQPVLRMAVALLPACCTSLEYLKPQEFSSVLWSCAKLGLHTGMLPEADAVFTVAANTPPAKLREFSVQGMTNVLYAFTEFLGTSPRSPYVGFLNVLALSVLERLHMFEPIGLLYVLESAHSLLARQESIPNVKRLATAAAQQAASHIAEYNTASVARLASLAGDLEPEGRQALTSALAWRALLIGLEQFRSHEIVMLNEMCGLASDDQQHLQQALERIARPSGGAPVVPNEAGQGQPPKALDAGRARATAPPPGTFVPTGQAAPGPAPRAAGLTAPGLPTRGSPAQPMPAKGAGRGAERGAKDGPARKGQGGRLQQQGMGPFQGLPPGNFNEGLLDDDEAGLAQMGNFRAESPKTKGQGLLPPSTGGYMPPGVFSSGMSTGPSEAGLNFLEPEKAQTTNKMDTYQQNSKLLPPAQEESSDEDDDDEGAAQPEVRVVTAEFLGGIMEPMVLRNVPQSVAMKNHAQQAQQLQQAQSQMAQQQAAQQAFASQNFGAKGNAMEEEDESSDDGENDRDELGEEMRVVTAEFVGGSYLHPGFFGSSQKYDTTEQVPQAVKEEESENDDDSDDEVADLGPEMRIQTAEFVGGSYEGFNLGGRVQGGPDPSAAVSQLLQQAAARGAMAQAQSGGGMPGGNAQLPPQRQAGMNNNDQQFSAGNFLAQPQGGRLGMSGENTSSSNQGPGFSQGGWVQQGGASGGCGGSSWASGWGQQSSSGGAAQTPSQNALSGSLASGTAGGLMAGLAGGLSGGLGPSEWESQATSGLSGGCAAPGIWGAGAPGMAPAASGPPSRPPGSFAPTEMAPPARRNSGSGNQLASSLRTPQWDQAPAWQHDLAGSGLPSGEVNPMSPMVVGADPAGWNSADLPSSGGALGGGSRRAPQWQGQQQFDMPIRHEGGGAHGAGGAFFDANAAAQAAAAAMNASGAQLGEAGFQVLQDFISQLPQWQMEQQDGIERPRNALGGAPARPLEASTS